MEQTAEEKLQKAEREFRDRMMAEMEERHHLSMEELREQQKTMMELYEERRAELLRQNEGMLGAVGRLHAENEKLKQENAASMAAYMNLEQKMKQKEQEIRLHMELIERESSRRIKDLEQKLVDKRAKSKVKSKR